MADDALEDPRPSLVARLVLAVDDAQVLRDEADLRLALLFERDPVRAAEIAAWLP